MSSSKIKCVICDESKWINVDEYRYKPSGMEMCENCGFITYGDIIKEDSKLKDFYREEYRQPPTVENLYTGQMKLHYHNAFLQDHLKTLKDEAVICEIGGAMGMFLDWVKKQKPKAIVYGTELTLSFRRVAWHKYGIKLNEEFDDSRKYDLICSYKVAEHQPHIDKLLRKYTEALTDDGRLYIGVPTWFNRLHNFGASGYDIEYYYHRNHINVWTRKHFETLLKKVGLEVVKENHTYYDSVYLCKRNDALMKEEPKYESKEQVLMWLKKIKDATDLYSTGDYKAAIETWNDFPIAWKSHYEMNRKQINDAAKGNYKWIKENVLTYALNSCKGDAATVLLCADIAMRYDEWREAIKYFELALSLKPGNEASFYGIAQCYRQLALHAKDEKDKINLLKQACNVTNILKDASLRRAPEATSWMFSDLAQIPCDWETEGETK